MDYSFSIDPSDENDRRSLMIATGVLLFTILWFVRSSQQNSDTNINIASTLTTQKSSSAILTNVATSAAFAHLLSYEISRLGFVVVNQSSSTMYLSYDDAASITHYTYTLLPLAEHRDNDYNGNLSAVLDSGSGVARVTDLRP